MNSKFPILSVVSLLLRIAGWGTILGGIVLGFTENREGSGLLASFVGLVAGLVIIAFGEIIGVLFAIEINTRNASVVVPEIPLREAAGDIETNECPGCGAPYDPADYSATASVWQCSRCKAEL